MRSIEELQAIADKYENTIRWCKKFDSCCTKYGKRIKMCKENGILLIVKPKIKKDGI